MVGFPDTPSSHLEVVIQLGIYAGIDDPLPTTLCGKVKGLRVLQLEKIY